jgi:hypothetical integral membrane protein (TIGR02206 family)
MQTDFRLFGPVHLSIIAAIPLSAAALTLASRRSPLARRAIAPALALALFMNEVVWNVWRIRHEGWRYPEGLPLQLCDLAIWATVVALLGRNQWAYELAYFAGLAGAGMATLTPDLWAPTCSYPTAYFFAAHGLTIAGVLYLAWSGLARPLPGCVWRAMAMVNGWAVLVGIFNALNGTNYFYLCRKPAGPSLLDFLGPWPWYLASVELVAALLFTLLWLPFRTWRRAPRAVPVGAGR